MDEYVWVLPKNGKIPCGARILANIGSRIKIQDDELKEYWISPEEIIRPMHPASVFGVEDMISLGELQQYTILRNLHIRYLKDLIYTYIGSILVAVNPYQQLPIYTNDIIMEYRKKKLGTLPPHIFAVADHSYENMRKMSERRCIVISGESGAGKTESTKLFLKYFASISKKISGKEKQILDSNPILEAFGNAKTLYNDNSSRFGKYISINFNTDGSIHSGQIKQYLLEKSRIVSQNNGEQNYHIFYSMLLGLSEEEKRCLNLGDISDYHYLNKATGAAQPSNPLHQNTELDVIKSAMKVLQFTDSEIWHIFELIAVILHFGNINFETAVISNLETVSSSSKEIQHICALLQVTEQQLLNSITKKTISTHNDHVMKFLSKQEAINSRDAFAKKIFGNLFNFVVDKINQVLAADDKRTNLYIGILDIFGFEAFERNSFEQLCINYANERLQQYFISHVFKLEQQQYANEGIQWKFVEYSDNKDILDLLETGPSSILSVINDATKIPRASDESMLDKLIKLHCDNPYFFKPKYKNTLVFGVQHFAGVVLYDSNEFVEKNFDACSTGIKNVVQSSKNSFLRQIFAQDFEEESNGYYKKRTETLISKFKTSLDLLMNELNESQPFFVRCIKPNEMKKPRMFDRTLCSKQLTYSGMTEVTKVREAGYPVRYDFVQFVQNYRMLVPGMPLAHKTPCRNATLRICQNVFKNFPKPDYQLGRTKIFLKLKEELYLEAEKEKVLYRYAVIIQKVVRGWLTRRRFCRLKKAVILSEKYWKERQQRIQGNRIRHGYYRLQAKLKSRQLSLEFQRYRDLITRLQAHCRGYLIRNSVKEKLQSLNIHKYGTEKQNDTAEFKEFAKKYFQDKHNHKFMKKPIKTSLTRLIHEEEEIAAKAIWLTILRYTKNISEGSNKVSKVSGLSKLKEILKTIQEVATGTESMEKISRLYVDWLETKTNEIEKLHFIIGHGIERPELRDEIYCQICKILTKNPSQKSNLRGWDLLSSCTGCFPPSDLFFKYLKTFIRQGHQKYVSYCLFRLHRTIQNGIRTQPLYSTELQAVKRQKPISLDVYLMNGTSTSLKIDSATTVAELLNLAAKNIKLNDIFGFSLILAHEMKRLSLGDGSGFVLDAISECEQYIMNIEGNTETMPWTLYLKKEIFSPWDKQNNDEVANRLIYSQIKEGILGGEYGFDETQLPSLIAHICYVEKNNMQPFGLNDIISCHLPYYFVDFSTDYLDCFKEKVKTFYENAFGMNRSVNSVRNDLIKYAASNWTMQFSRFFNLVGTVKNPKSAEPYSDVPLVIAVNSSGIYVIDESDERRTVAQVDFVEIREVTCKDATDSKGHNLNIVTYSGTEVSLILQTRFELDLHKLLIKIIESLRKNSKFVIAIKNYKTSDKSFLELEKGDLITLSEKFTGKDLQRSTWSKGTNERTGQTGTFLLDCVEIISAVEKPPDAAVSAIRKVVLHGEQTQQICQFTVRLKHFSLESYAEKFFRKQEKDINGTLGNKPDELWKYSKDSIDMPLHARFVHKEKEAKLAVEIFKAILRYTERNEPFDVEEQLVRRIFGPGLEHEELRDEIYCQIMKQLTCNFNEESKSKSWELLWMITGLFPCGKILSNEVKKFLQSRRKIQSSRECLSRFYKILNSEPRKHPPHKIEIEAIKNKPCHIFHRIYFPDDDHKFFQIDSTIKFKELKEVVLNRLKINLPKKDFGLFVQAFERLYLGPDDYYLFDFLQIFKQWAGKNSLSGEKCEYKIYLMKHNWENPSNEKMIDLKFIFPQEYHKYIQGYYNIPQNDLVELAALLYKVYSLNKTPDQFEKNLPKILPSKAVVLKKAEIWQKEIQTSYKPHILSTKDECEVKFVKYLRNVVPHKSPYFVVRSDTYKLKNYIFYPVTSNSRIKT